MDTQSNRAHRPSKEKKVPKKGEKNVKAFAVAKPGRLAKQAARASDIREKRLHVPQVDRLPEEAPPIVTAVVGPPGVGKTTLIKSLIKRYTKQTLSHPTGPLTVVTSKRRRLTFIECPSDSLAAMMDVAKVADIVLLMIDGNYGFEMETMEFLNALSTSGMPGNIFGILTHLDLFKRQATLKAAKKKLKHRFWSELYQGAKLFYLSGVINGRYPDREIHNLSRFLSIMKNPRPLVWRNSHPYCLADRFLDVTPPTLIEENGKCDRQIALYGYLRGTNFPAVDARVHVPGVGDLTIHEIEALPDPCPTPYIDQAIAKATGKSSRKRLGEKQKLLFAPMSDVGGVLVDKDAVYIDIKTNTFDRDAEDLEERGLGEQLMVNLQNERRLLGEVDGGVRLFSGSNLLDDREGALTGRQQKRNARFIEGEQNGHDDLIADDDDEGVESGEDEGGEDLSDGESEPEEDSDADITPPQNLRLGRHGSSQRHDKPGEVAFADSDSDLGSLSEAEGDNVNGEEDSELDSEEEDDDSGGMRWKDKMVENVRRLQTLKVAYRAADLSRMLYAPALSPAQIAAKWAGRDTVEPNEEVEKDEDEDTFLKRSNVEMTEDQEDRMTPLYNYEELARKWNDEEELQTIKQRFTKSRLNDEDHDGRNGDANDNMDSSDEQESNGDGDFEDLEADETNGNGQTDTNGDLSIEEERALNAKKKEELKSRFEEEDREGFLNTKNEVRQTEEEFGEDEWYDAQKAAFQKQRDINQAEFNSLDPQARSRVEGYRAGTYARLVLDNVPYEFAKSFSPRFPVIVGGLGATEDRFGYLQVRIKRHRWHKKILKTNDPLIFSLGWRRFQTIPLYAISDSRTRNRILKYTPEHMHCFGTFYGPLVAPNTGFCCVQSFSNANPGFRIAATGVVLNVDENVDIVKKLKLTGYPYKIFRNTAFIRDMFTSALEVVKFEGASVRTVSGVRGQIKRALSKPDGHYRATFEDKILMSDIVFLRAWYAVKPHRFYNPVTNLLDAPPPTTAAVSSTAAPDTTPQTSTWQPMRLTGAIRASLALPTPTIKDSTYRPITRPTRHFNPLRIPSKLATSLPFRSQPTLTPARRAGKTYLSKRAVVLGGEERRARDLLQKLATMRKEKVEKRRVKKHERSVVHGKEVEKGLGLKREREKRERDEFWRREGKKRGRSGGWDRGGDGDGEDAGGAGRGGGGKRQKTS